jgi:NDP-mannose synthase
MGIYLFNPQALAFIPHNQRLDLPDLMLKMIAQGETVRCYRCDGYWLDIGRIDDYQLAVQDFERNRALFLPGENQQDSAAQ